MRTEMWVEIRHELPIMDYYEQRETLFQDKSTSWTEHWHSKFYRLTIPATGCSYETTLDCGSCAEKVKVRVDGPGKRNQPMASGIFVSLALLSLGSCAFWAYGSAKAGFFGHMIHFAFIPLLMLANFFSSPSHAVPLEMPAEHSLLHSSPTHLRSLGLDPG